MRRGSLRVDAEEELVNLKNRRGKRRFQLIMR